VGLPAAATEVPTLRREVSTSAGWSSRPGRRNLGLKDGGSHGVWAAQDKSDVRRLAGMCGSGAARSSASTCCCGRYTRPPTWEASSRSLQSWRRRRRRSRQRAPRRHEAGLRPLEPSVVRVDGSRNGLGAESRADGKIVATASRQKRKNDQLRPFDTEWCSILFGLSHSSLSLRVRSFQLPLLTIRRGRSARSEGHRGPVPGGGGVA